MIWISRCSLFGLSLSNIFQVLTECYRFQQQRIKNSFSVESNNSQKRCKILWKQKEFQVFESRVVRDFKHSKLLQSSTINVKILFFQKKVEKHCSRIYLRVCSETTSLKNGTTVTVMLLEHLLKWHVRGSLKKHDVNGERPQMKPVSIISL